MRRNVILLGASVVALALAPVARAQDRVETEKHVETLRDDEPDDDDRRILRLHVEKGEAEGDEREERDEQPHVFRFRVEEPGEPGERGERRKVLRVERDDRDDRDHEDDDRDDRGPRKARGHAFKIFDHFERAKRTEPARPHVLVLRKGDDEDEGREDHFFTVPFGRTRAEAVPGRPALRIEKMKALEPLHVQGETRAVHVVRKHDEDDKETARAIKELVGVLERIERLLDRLEHRLPAAHAERARPIEPGRMIEPRDERREERREDRPERREERRERD